MKKTIFYIAGSSGAAPYIQKMLTEQGISVANQPDPDVTHLLLPVPSFEKDGRIKGGGILEHILADLPENITVIGGNLQHPSLHSYPKIDLLHHRHYLAMNSAITADCAIRVAGAHLKTTFRDCPVLVIGWGRIGKCLSSLLKEMDSKVTVAARKETDRCALQSLGFHALDIPQVPSSLPQFRLIFNTVPAPMLEPQHLRRCHPNRVLIELASQPGLISSDAIQALGLPGKYAPEASADLIVTTIMELIKEGSV